MPRNYFGTNGDDTVNQNANNNYFNIYTKGGDDNITLRLNNTHVEAGSGDDTVTSKIENNNDVFLGTGDDTYIGNGFAHNNHFDIVYGDAGDDRFNVATRQSDYYGGDDKDTFNSVGYFNYFNGGNGIDTVSYQRQDSSALSGVGVKIDLFHEYSTTGNGREEDIVNVENAIGTSYADTIIGDNGSNTLWGMDGADIVDGRSGADTLYGGNNGDDIFGGGRKDTLIGGAGRDFLEGGTGSDTFLFENTSDSKFGSSRDVITDFSHSSNDRIDVSIIDAISGGGDDDFDFIGNSGFSGTAGELQFKNHLIAGDVDGDGKADFQIRVDDVASLQNGDFIL